jgi:hypothetical protein
VLRIDVERAGASRVSVALIGDFCAGELAEIGRLIDEARRSGERVAIDLSAVRRIDREAVRFLAFGGGRVADLVGCPAYVREWMRCESMQ